MNDRDQCKPNPDRASLARRLWRRAVPRRIRESGSTASVVVWLLMWLVMLALVALLIDVEKPWSPEIWDEPVGDFRIDEWVPLGLWWGALVNLFVVAILIITSRWWLPFHKSQPPPATAASPRAACLNPRLAAGWLLVVLGASAMAGWLAEPRLDLSLWGDEEHSLRQCVLGEHRIDDETGDLYYRPHPLGENLWMYIGPNNHFLLTLLARLSLEAWHATTWDGGLYFDETVYRLPSYVAGLLTVVAVAVLLRCAGFPVAGMVAAWLLAIHPWFIRYITEARGYSLMMLFATLAAIALLLALSRRSWKWWVLFALCEFLFLYAYPGALYLALCLNLAALVVIVADRGRGTNAVPQLWRWFVTNTAAAVVAIQLLAPTIPQMALWLQRDRAKADLGLSFLQDFWAYLSSGMAFHTWDPLNPICQSWQRLGEGDGLADEFLLLAPAFFCLLGILRLLASGRRLAALGLALALAPLVGFAMIQGGGNILYVWYLIYALPFFVCFVALGIETLTWLFVRPWPGLHFSAPLALAVAVLGCFWLATDRQRAIIRDNAVEPQRDSVLLTRPSLDPYHPSVDHITTLNVTFTTPFYDPRAIKLDPEDGVERLREFMAAARRTGSALYVNLGSEGLARHVYPEVMRIIEKSGEFELVQRLWGLNLQNTRVVYRYIGGGRKSDFARASGGLRGEAVHRVPADFLGETPEHRGIVAGIDDGGPRQHAVLDREARQLVDPEPVAVDLAPVSAVVAGHLGEPAAGRQCAPGEQSAFHRVANPLAGERLDHPSGIAHQQQPRYLRVCSLTLDRADRLPDRIGRQLEVLAGP